MMIVIFYILIAFFHFITTVTFQVWKTQKSNNLILETVWYTVASIIWPISTVVLLLEKVIKPVGKIVMDKWVQFFVYLRKS